MDLFNLGSASWQESQLIYHSLAKLGREGLCLVSPATPYVCIGWHQNARQEVDIEFCRKNNIPVFRREVGGGAVYLDGRQLFYQLILRRDNPAIPLNRETFYRKFIEPVAEVYRQIGVPAQYKPINDIVAGGRKVSGTGVGEIGDCIVFVGNLIVDFNYEMMSRVLKVPDEKFRDKVRKTIEDNLGTIKQELGEDGAARWSDDALNNLLVEEFGKIFGAFTETGLDNDIKTKADELTALMINDEWLFRKGRRIEGREIKIRADVNMVHRMHKAEGGLIRADFELRNGLYENLTLSGDWFCYPENAVEKLETLLTGNGPDEAEAIIAEYYETGSVETPGITINDWLMVLKG